MIINIGFAALGFLLGWWWSSERIIELTRVNCEICKRAKEMQNKLEGNDALAALLPDKKGKSNG